MSPLPPVLPGSPELFRRALVESLRKLRPARLWMNPVIFATAAAALIATAGVVGGLFAGHFRMFALFVALGLWLLVAAANFFEALAEVRGQARAAGLLRAPARRFARRLRDDREVKVPASDLARGDIVVCEAGDIIPADGEVIEGIASVDESAMTGESALVIRESGARCSAVTGGTVVLANRIVVRITAEAGGGFLDHLASLVETPRPEPTPPMIVRGMLAAAVVGILASLFPSPGHFSFGACLALVVCLLPTTIAGLRRTVDLRGIDLLVRRNVVPATTRAVNAAGHIDVVVLDRTGAITQGDRRATEFLPAPGVPLERLAEAAQLASLSDETPEGRSIVVFAKTRFGLRPREAVTVKATYIPFNAQTRMSGVDLLPYENRPARRIRKGEAASLRAWIESQKGVYPPEVAAAVDRISRAGGTPLVVAENGAALGIARLEDAVKGGAKERFAELRRLGVRSIMMTGDNPLAAAAVAAESGVDDYVAQATPAAKLKRIRDEQAAGRVVAMVGNGTSDTPALAQADVGVAMNSGTQAAREAGNMIDLDSNPMKLIEIVRIGRRFAGTRGALGFFSLANDAAKYLAVVPAVVAGAAAGGLWARLNFLRLHSPDGAILSAILVNALSLVAFLALSLRTATDPARNPVRTNARNLLLFGGGGVIASLAGIKAIDAILAGLQAL
jgi:K+-transporting ATPase ATPase B chain